MRSNKVHKVRFKKEPIWVTANFGGHYEGMQFGMKYKEFWDKEIETVIKSYIFTWIGRIPDDKAYAEEGIKVLFNKLKMAENSTISWDVTGPFTIEEEEIDAIVKEELDNLDASGITDIIKNEEVKD